MFRMTTNEDIIESLFLNSETNTVLMLKNLCASLFASETDADLKKTEREMRKINL